MNITHGKLQKGNKWFCVVTTNNGFSARLVTTKKFEMNNKSDYKPRFTEVEFAVGPSQNRPFVTLLLNKFLPSYVLSSDVQVTMVFEDQHEVLKLSPISYLSASTQPTSFLLTRPVNYISVLSYELRNALFLV